MLVRRWAEMQAGPPRTERVDRLRRPSPRFCGTALGTCLMTLLSRAMKAARTAVSEPPRTPSGATSRSAITSRKIRLIRTRWRSSLTRSRTRSERLGSGSTYLIALAIPASTRPTMPVGHCAASSRVAARGRHLSSNQPMAGAQVCIALKPENTPMPWTMPPRCLKTPRRRAEKARLPSIPR